MKNNNAALMTGMILTLLSLQGVAQTSGKALKVPAEMDNPAQAADSDTGLRVEEVRSKDRLNTVVIEHEASGVREYYNMDNDDEIYQDGGLIERGASRSWRLGGNKK